MYILACQSTHGIISLPKCLQYSLYLPKSNSDGLSSSAVSSIQKLVSNRYRITRAYVTTAYVASTHPAQVRSKSIDSNLHAAPTLFVVLRECLVPSTRMQVESATS